MRISYEYDVNNPTKPPVPDHVVMLEASQYDALRTAAQKIIALAGDDRPEREYNAGELADALSSATERISNGAKRRIDTLYDNHLRRIKRLSKILANLVGGDPTDYMLPGGERVLEEIEYQIGTSQYNPGPGLGLAPSTFLMRRDPRATEKATATNQKADTSEKVTATEPDRHADIKTVVVLLRLLTTHYPARLHGDNTVVITLPTGAASYHIPSHQAHMFSHLRKGNTTDIIIDTDLPVLVESSDRVIAGHPYHSTKPLRQTVISTLLDDGAQPDDVGKLTDDQLAVELRKRLPISEIRTDLAKVVSAFGTPEAKTLSTRQLTTVIRTHPTYTVVTGERDLRYAAREILRNLEIPTYPTIASETLATKLLAVSNRLRDILNGGSGLSELERTAAIGDLRKAVIAVLADAGIPGAKMIYSELATALTTQRATLQKLRTDSATHETETGDHLKNIKSLQSERAALLVDRAQLLALLSLYYPLNSRLDYYRGEPMVTLELDHTTPFGKTISYEIPQACLDLFKHLSWISNTGITTYHYPSPLPASDSIDREKRGQRLAAEFKHINSAGGLGKLTQSQATRAIADAQKLVREVDTLKSQKTIATNQLAELASDRDALLILAGKHYHSRLFLDGQLASEAKEAIVSLELPTSGSTTEVLYFRVKDHVISFASLKRGETNAKAIYTGYYAHRYEALLAHAKRL